MLPFENAKLLPKNKVFEEQVAARAKEASGHDRQKPQQAQHENSFARARRTTLGRDRPSKSGCPSRRGTPMDSFLFSGFELGLADF
jgi:hypothetical protein